MRFESIKLRGLGAFRGEVSIDFSAIAGPLVAITGPNGAGKSTLLELLAGALYRDCPTRGTLASLATERGAYVEVRAVNGRAFTVRQTIDAISGKGEALILDDAGRPVFESGKVKDGDAWVAEHLLSPAVLYSSSFAAQGSQGFSALSRTERKGVLLRVLQIERYEALAAAARERAGAAKAHHEAIRARIAELPAPDMDALRAAVSAALATAGERTAATHAARQALERAKVAAADAVRAREYAEQRAAAARRSEQAARVLRDLEERLKNNRDVLAQADEIAAAVTRTGELERAAEAARSLAATSAAELAAAREAHERTVTERTAANAAFINARTGADRCKARLADRDRILEAVAQVASLAELEKDGVAALRELDARVVELERLQLGGKDERIRDLRTGLQAISAKPSLAKKVADEVLRQDDAAGAKQEAAPGALKTAREKVLKGRRSLEGLREQRSAAERLAARAPDLEVAEADLVVANEELARARGRGAAALEQLEAAASRFEGAQRAHAAAQSAVAPLTAEIQQLAGLVGKAKPLAQAQARVEELAAQLEPAKAALQQAEADLSALPVIEAESIDLAAHERQLEQTERMERESIGVGNRAQKAVEDAEVVLVRRSRLATEADAAAGELIDWTRLAQDLGRDGLQALEIDAAVPELNELANDLLHACAGSRFTVEVRTDRLSADGKRVLEGLDLRVIDTKPPARDDLLETYSGGERVIVSEAIALALTTLACRRAGLERPTLVRDERGASFDPENGRAYMAMLRRAAQLIGADKVLYVSHTPELQELADARIEIAGGKAEVRA